MPLVFPFSKLFKETLLHYILDKYGVFEFCLTLTMNMELFTRFKKVDLIVSLLFLFSINVSFVYLL